MNRHTGDRITLTLNLRTDRGLIYWMIMGFFLVNGIGHRLFLLKKIFATNFCIKKIAFKELYDFRDESLNRIEEFGINVALSSTWSLALDDLRVYADLFDSPLQFLHFLKHRSLAEASGLVELNDELEHIAMYFNYNNYAMYSEEIISEDETNHIHWHGLNIDIDKYYSNVLAEPDKQHEKPKQKLNLYIRQILNILTSQEKQGRAKVADYILDASDEYRKQIEDGILHSLKRQKELKRIFPIHLFGDLNLSIFCIQKGINNPNVKWKKEYLWSALIAYKHKSTLALDIQFNRNNQIFNIDFTFIDIAEIPKYSLDKINQQASEIKRRLMPTSE